MEKILVVDDDPHAVKLYKVLLERAGFEVFMAINGSELLPALEKNKPDIILLDVMLPDSNGFDLCRDLKRNPLYGSVKVLMVSATQISASSIAQGIDVGADDYLRKPFDLQELLSRIRSLLKMKRVEEELRNHNNQLKRLSHHLQNIREEERTYLAGEVHEELGQLAAAVKMDIDWLADAPKESTEEAEQQRLSHASHASQQLISSIRKIATTLRPSMLDHLGLNASLEWLCKEFTNHNDIECVFETSFHDEQLDSKKRTELFRICEEALNNVTCDKASLVTVSVTEDKDTICLTITDNGENDNIQEKGDTLGMIILKERAMSIHGRLTMEAIGDKGIAIRVAVPKDSINKEDS